MHKVKIRVSIYTSDNAEPTMVLLRFKAEYIHDICKSVSGAAFCLSNEIFCYKMFLILIKLYFINTLSLL